MGKKIAIVGAGALGGHVGAYLTRSGEDVILIDPWPEHVEQMRGHGLELLGVTEDENFTTPVRAMHLTEVQCLTKEPIDIAFVSTKSYDTVWATTMIAQYLAPGGFVVSLQNSINEERIAGVVGWGKTVGCIASMIAVELFEPGRIQRNVSKGGEKHIVFRVGEVHGRTTERVTEIAEMLKPVDSSKVTENLWGERWSKLCINAMRNSVSASTGQGGNQNDREEVTRRLAIRLAGEAIDVGLALGYDLENMYGMSPAMISAAGGGDAAALEEVENTLIENTRFRNDEQRPSMGQDIRKGRRTEIDFINGLVAEKGKEAGIPTPANEAIAEVVRKVERGELKPDPANVAHI